MKEWLFPDTFENRMGRTSTALGWLYLPLHIVVLPLLLGVYGAVDPSVSGAALNLAYYGVGVAFVLCVMFRFLRDGFDALLDRPGWCFASIVWGVLIIYSLGGAVQAILILFEDELVNPNNATLEELAGTDYGITKAIALFLAPIVEEGLFRGVVFGSLRKRQRVLAYAVSIVLFGLYHVWQYAFLYADPLQLIYALQYLPHGLVLAWCYDRTNSIWTSIFLHMGVNAIAFWALGFV